MVAGWLLVVVADWLFSVVVVVSFVVVFVCLWSFFLFCLGVSVGCFVFGVGLSVRSCISRFVVNLLFLFLSPVSGVWSTSVTQGCVCVATPGRVRTVLCGEKWGEVGRGGEFFYLFVWGCCIIGGDGGEKGGRWVVGCEWAFESVWDESFGSGVGVGGSCSGG